MLLFLLVAFVILQETLPIEYEDFDESYSYYNDDGDSENLTWTPLELPRMRRYPDPVKRMEPQDTIIKEALEKIMSGRRIEDWNYETSVSEVTREQGDTDTDETSELHDQSPTTNDLTITKENKHDDSILADLYGAPIRAPIRDYPTVAEAIYDDWIRMVPSRSTPKNQNTNGDQNRNDDQKELKEYIKNMTRGESGITMKTSTVENNRDDLTASVYEGPAKTEDNNTEDVYDDDWLKIVPGRTTLKNQNTNDTKSDQDYYSDRHEGDVSEKEMGIQNVGREGNTTSTTSANMCLTTNATTTPTTTTTTKKTTIVFDVEKFLEIVANLTYDYYTNLTDQVNETMIKMGVPTCATPTTTEQITTTIEPGFIDYSSIKKYLIAKCFVCGLEDRGIPYDANCADAFAGDFIPLVPQDPRAKGLIVRFRKYCRYKNVDNFQLNTSMPRSIFGRWTGGCSVRWTDISGVYTQRSCRNRRQAAMGKHFASKRMAKLEMSLASMDNGCIISPVASLMSFSRGISLFARVHACVCTGSWCNTSAQLDSDILTSVIALTAVAWMNARN